MSHRKVRDVMTTQLRTVRADTPVKAVAEQMEAGRISALPVLDEKDHLVGVVSEADLLHKITYQDDTDDWPLLLRRHRVDRTKASGTTARDVMTAPAVTVPAAASVVEAAAAMEKHHVKRLPVVDDDGALVGIVSRRDLVRLFVRSDEEIRDEVRSDVVGRVLMAEPDAVTVEVTAGEVRLRGTLERKSETEIAVAVTRRIDGVVNVIDELDFTNDDTKYRALRAEVDQPAGPYF